MYLNKASDSIESLKILLQEFQTDFRKQVSSIHDKVQSLESSLRFDGAKYELGRVSFPDSKPSRFDLPFCDGSEDPTVQFGHSNGSSGYLRSKFFEFPKYDGSYDPSVWIKDANAYFSFHHTPIGHRVDTASFHLQGKALGWFWNILASRPSVSWLDLVDEFKFQFITARNHRQASFTHSLVPGTLSSNEKFTLSVQTDRNEQNPHGIVDNSAFIVSPSTSHHEDPISNVLESVQMSNAFVSQDMFYMTGQRYTEQQQSVQHFAPPLSQALFEEDYNQPQLANLSDQNYDLFTNRRSMRIQDNVIIMDVEPAQWPSLLAVDFDKNSPADDIVKEKDSHVVQSETISSESEVEHVFWINHEACKHQQQTEAHLLPGSVITKEELVKVCNVGSGTAKLHLMSASVWPSKMYPSLFSSGIQNFGSHQRNICVIIMDELGSFTSEPQFLLIQLPIGLSFAASIVIQKPIVPFLVMLKKQSLDAQCSIQHRPPPKPPPDPPPTAACFPMFFFSH